LVKGYTIDGARQLRIDGHAGSIEVGKAANLIVLDQDLFSIAADRIRELRPATVLFEGNVVSGSL